MPLTEKLELVVTETLVYKVILKKSSVTAFVILAPVVSKVIVPADGTKFAPVPMFNETPTKKLVEIVTVALSAIARFLKLSVPELEIEEPFLIVTVAVPIEVKDVSIPIDKE